MPFSQALSRGGRRSRQAASSPTRGLLGETEAARSGYRRWPNRVWRTRSQLELAIVDYLGWFNNARLHESLGDIRPPNASSSTTTEKRPRSSERPNPVQLSTESVLIFLASWTATLDQAEPANVTDEL